MTSTIGLVILVFTMLLFLFDSFFAGISQQWRKKIRGELAMVEDAFPIMRIVWNTVFMVALTLPIQWALEPVTSWVNFFGPLMVGVMSLVVTVKRSLDIINRNRFVNKMVDDIQFIWDWATQNGFRHTDGLNGGKTPYCTTLRKVVGMVTYTLECYNKNEKWNYYLWCNYSDTCIHNTSNPHAYFPVELIRSVSIHGSTVQQTYQPLINTISFEQSLLEMPQPDFIWSGDNVLQVDMALLKSKLG